MQTAAAYYNIKMYLAILVVPKQLFISYGSKTLEQSGFKIRVIAAETIPFIRLNMQRIHILLSDFLKKYDEFNPKSEFAAIMTCSQADGGVFYCWR
jgi:arsenate reductase